MPCYGMKQLCLRQLRRARGVERRGMSSFPTSSYRGRHVSSQRHRTRVQGALAPCRVQGGALALPSSVHRARQAGKQGSVPAATGGGEAEQAEAHQRGGGGLWNTGIQLGDQIGGLSRPGAGTHGEANRVAIEHAQCRIQVRGRLDDRQGGEFRRAGTEIEVVERIDVVAAAAVAKAAPAAGG